MRTGCMCCTKSFVTNKTKCIHHFQRLLWQWLQESLYKEIKASANFLYYATLVAKEYVFRQNL